MEEGSFSFMKKVPSELAHPLYCPQCFDEKVSAPLVSYNETLERAKEVLVFSKDESKKTRLFSRKEEPVQVAECLDKDETILRLAFLAAQKQFNSIIDVELKSEKVMNGSHRYHVWKGRAIPCNLDDRQLNRDYSDQ